jgi:hypothetical protein
MCVAAQRRFVASTATPAAARLFSAAAVIAGLKPIGWDVSDDAALVTSEFTTAAVLAGASYVDVRVDLHYDRIEIGISDDRPVEPLSAPPAVNDDPSAHIVAALALKQGTHIGNGATSTWAWLDCDPAFTVDLACDRR